MMNRFGFRYYVVAVFAFFLASIIYMIQTIKDFLVTFSFIQRVRVSLRESPLVRAVLVASLLLMFCLANGTNTKGGKKECVSGTLYTHVNL